MSNKNYVPLNEFILLQRGFDLPQGERIYGDVPVVASTGIAGFHNEYKVGAPGVVIGRSGTIGGGQYITQNFWPLNTTLWVKDFKGHNARYVYYLLKSIDFQRFNVGTGVPTLNRNHLSSVLVKNLEYKNEKVIAKILGDLDDKIYLNNQINQTLESIAQAIFKSWFIDFEPVRAKIAAKQEGEDPELAAICAISGKSEAELEQMAKEDFAELQATAALFPDELVESELGEVPKGWEIGCVGDIATVRGGYAFKSLQFVDKGYPVIKIKNITGDGKVDIQDTQCIEEKTAQIASKFILNDSDLVMAMTGATVGKIGLVNTYGKLVYLNQRVAKFESDTFGNKVGYYLFCLFNRSEYFEQIVGTAQGSAQPNISSNGIESTRIIVPNFEVINLFIRKVDSIFQYWLENGSVNNTLREVRDALLPKLLSGEVSVEDIKQQQD